jgi:hypothetical protein
LTFLKIIGEALKVANPRGALGKLRREMNFLDFIGLHFFAIGKDLGKGKFF